MPVDQSGRVIPDPEVLGLPLSPQFIAADQQLEQEMWSTLLGIGVQRDTIPRIIESMKSRLKTDQGLEELDINQSMADRGMMNSTITGRTQMETNLPRQRQWEDFMNEMNETQGQLSAAEQAARYQRMLGRDQLLADYAAGLDPRNSAIRHGNVDYYEQGGADSTYYDSHAPGGEWDDYSDFVEQPGPPKGYGDDRFGPPSSNPGRGAGHERYRKWGGFQKNQRSDARDRQNKRRRRTAAKPVATTRRRSKRGSNK